jgi:hypothetical protein
VPVVKAATPVVKTTPAKTSLWGSLTSAVKKVVTPVASALASTVKKVATPVVNTVKKVVTPIVNTVKKVVAPIVSTVKKIVTPIVNAVKKVVEPVVSTVKKVVTPVVNTVKKVVEPVVNTVKSIPAAVASTTKAVASSVVNTLSPKQGGGAKSVVLAKDPPPPVDINILPDWLKAITQKANEVLFADETEPPTTLDRLFNREWNEARSRLSEDIKDTQNGDEYFYNDRCLGIDWWKSNLSIEQLEKLQELVNSKEVSWDDTLTSIGVLQSYKGYDNVQMISALREIYYKDALDNFILGAQKIDSSSFEIFERKNGIDKNDAQYARALLLLTTQGDKYADPVTVIQHPQGYPETGEFEFDHIIAALDGSFHNSPNGYIPLDLRDNEVRPPSRFWSTVNSVIGGPIDSVEIVKNLVSKGLFLRMNTDTSKIDSVSAVTWQGDLAGATAKAYEYGNAEEGYAKEMPPHDLEGDMLGVILIHNHAINPNGTNLAGELSSALAADSPYVTNKYTQFAQIIGLKPDGGQITPESAQVFLKNNFDMDADLGSGFYVAHNPTGVFSAMSPNGQDQIEQYAKDQINHFLQQIQDGVQVEAGQ